jgi:hypothetical protein
VPSDDDAFSKGVILGAPCTNNMCSSRLKARS